MTEPTRASRDPGPEAAGSRPSVRTALAIERERITVLIFYGIVLVLGYLLYQVFQPFLVPLAWSAVLAIFVFPWHTRLEARFGRTRAAALSTAIVTLLIIGPGFLIISAFIREGTAALTGFDRNSLRAPLVWVQERWVSLAGALPPALEFDLTRIVEQAAERVAGFIAGRAGSIVANIAVFLFNLFVALFALFFLLRDAPSIVSAMRRALPFEEPRRERMIAQTRNLVYASITSGMLIALLQGFLGGLIFAILGLQAPVFWGVVMGFFSFVPFFGTWVVWLPAGIWLLVSGQIVKGIVLIAFGSAVVASVDNVVRPAILAGRAQMNGLLMFISLLGGISVFGLLGLILGPLVVALAAGLLEAYTAPPEPTAKIG